MNNSNSSIWRWQDAAIVVLGVAVLTFALINYKALPDQLPLHFDIRGNVNRYGKKLNVIGLLAFFGLFLPLILGVVRRIDPRQSNYDKFQNAFGMIRLAIAAVLDLLLVAVVLNGLGHKINMKNDILLGVGLLFIVMGNSLPQVKGNFFVGFRTPWTLSDPEVWRKTHRLGGRLWVLAGILTGIAAFLPDFWSRAAVIVSIISLAVIPTVYSWWISKKPD